MARMNRVDPYGDLHAVGDRGLFTGNRGCLVDDHGTIVRHHRGSLWIICELEYRGRRQPVAPPGRWTPVFFLDDAVALAAGHRPCGLCRRGGYGTYRDAVTRGLGRSIPLTAGELNQRLAAERLRRGRGLHRGSDRKTWRAQISALPDGTVILAEDGPPLLVRADGLLAFTFDGWTEPRVRPSVGEVDVLTPPTSVIALNHGFVPVLHPSADPDRDR